MAVSAAMPRTIDTEKTSSRRRLDRESRHAIRQVQGVIGILLQVIPPSRLAMHFHDTRGTALANTLAALEMGISTFDASAGGLGGCPYAPGASGNMATEDLVYLLEGMAIDSGVDLKKLVEASAVIAPYLDHPLPGRYLQACTKAGAPVAPASASPH